MKRKISISTSFDYSLSISSQIPLIADAGFTHVSLGENAEHSGYLDRAGRRRFKTLLSSYGLLLDTIHGPRVDQIASSSLLGAIDAAAELGATVVVAHGGPFDFPVDESPSRMAALRHGCAAVAPALAETGVVLALENVMPGPATDIVRSVLPDLDPEFFGFCYDSAHDQIGGPRPFDLLSELSDRTKAVHLSDRIREFVDHVPPGDGFIDWAEICPLLRATSFHGPLLFEVMVLHAPEKDAARLLRRTFERGCGLYDQIFSES
jgi:sugar phosphate isomerase/epimerase